MFSRLGLILTISCVLLLGCSSSTTTTPVAENRTSSVLNTEVIQSDEIDVSSDKSANLEDDSLRATQILFMRNDKKNQNNDIYCMNADGSNRVNLTHVAADDAFADWSPDKSKIIFESIREYHNCNSLYTMNSDGTNVKLLTPASSFYQFPAWSPDGTKIAFCKARTAATGLMHIVRHNIWIMNTDGSGQKQITFGNDQDVEILPRWFADSNRIAYLSLSSGYYHINSVDITTLNQKDYGIHIVVPANQGDLPWFDLSPDGTKIVFTNDMQRDHDVNNRELFIYDISDKQVTQLTKNEYGEDHPCFSPDGKKIMFWRDSNGIGTPQIIRGQRVTMVDDWDDLGICTMNIDGTGLKKIDGTDYYDSPLKWR